MIYATAIFAFLLPIAALVIWKKKTGITFFPFLAGALCFMLFAMGLEQLLHGIFLAEGNPVSQTIMGTPWLYVLYGCLSAGIFEETGRLFGFKLLLRNYPEKETSVAYGIGHGGIESILTLGLSYLILSLVKLGITIGDAEAEAMLLDSIGTVTWSSALLAMLERVSAMTLHIGLSILVFAAANREGKKYLYPAAIVLHALADVPAALYQTGILKSIPLVEGIALLCAVCILLFGTMIYRKMDLDTDQGSES